MPAERLFKRAIVRVSPEDEGEDATAFLQGLVTNDMKAEMPLYSGLLSAQGKTLFDFIVWPSHPGTWLLDCEADVADELVKRLSLYRLRRKIAISRDNSLGVYWQAELGDGGAPDPRLGDLGQRWIAAVGEDDEAADDAWLRHRLSLGVPEGAAELADVLWLETNAAELNGVSFTKGCYIGQENTARMNWRQKVNRRLVVVPLDKSDPARRKAEYPDLGYAVDHLRMEGEAREMLPVWLRQRLDEAATSESGGGT